VSKCNSKHKLKLRMIRSVKLYACGSKPRACHKNALSFKVRTWCPGLKEWYLLFSSMDVVKGD
jgi:hypothetical protein